MTVVLGSTWAYVWCGKLLSFAVAVLAKTLWAAGPPSAEWGGNNK